MAIFTGETVEKAVERGLSKLDVSRENVHITIEQYERSGFLGFGRQRARVNIEVIDEATINKADRYAIRGTNRTSIGGIEVKTAEEIAYEMSQSIKAAKEADRLSEHSLSDQEKEEIINTTKLSFGDKLAGESSIIRLEDESDDLVSDISKYLTSITQDMGISASVSVRENTETGRTVLELHSKQDGLLIGKHGKILQSLQLLVQTYANTLTDDYLKIDLDAGGYLDKREAYLKSLARNAIDKARLGEVVYINDLQSHERKIIHAIISREDGIMSHSEGPESRKVIVVQREYY